MSNNAAVCANGAEIGRSQALQAFAAGAEPCSDMNPILLKPEGNSRSQVIVNGRPMQTLEASDYFQRRTQLWPHVTQALDRLRDQFELVVIEGAGSPAELNLADVEMVNMSVARYCHAPVVLIGDIERGGVFAQLLGTLWLLEREDRRRVCGLIVNKFRGDLSLFDRGVELLEERGGVPVLGVLPWIEDLHLPEEDSLALDLVQKSQVDEGKIDIAVIRLPHISNFDDFDPLGYEPSVHLRYAKTVDQLGMPDVIILPGTKNTIGDLEWLNESGLAARLRSCVQQGTHLVGICGGYQMLGNRILNPHRLETGVEFAKGLEFLDIETVFHFEKNTCQVETRILDEAIVPGLVGLSLAGYEIHVGQTTTTTPWLARSVGPTETGPAANMSISSSSAKTDGSHSLDGRVWGCYLHGLFLNDTFRSAWLRKLSGNKTLPRPLSAHEHVRKSLDRLADQFEAHIDFELLMKIVFAPTHSQDRHHVG